MSHPEIPVDGGTRAGSRVCQRLATAGVVVTWLGAALALVALVGGGASNGANIGFGLAACIIWIWKASITDNRSSRKQAL